MKKSISNIGWDKSFDKEVYEHLAKRKFEAIEIAPTVWFDNPYSHINEAKRVVNDIYNQYGLKISSMQSIWYGQSGNIFASDEDRNSLKEYTFKAIEFASAISCGNLVFGNPKARNKGNYTSDKEVESFFKEISDYANRNNTCISLEANPVIYNTDFINFTEQAFEYCRSLKNSHLKVNVDLGTIIYYNESLEPVIKNIDLVNHIHISEPYLKKIEKRDIHKALSKISYDKYVSIEMGKTDNIQDVFDVIDYIGEVFA